MSTHSHFARLPLLLAGLLLAASLHAQSTSKSKIDYSVIPKMEEVKDHPAAPDFTLSRPDGSKVSLKDYRGKVVFLNFWATWCPSCRTEMPDMEKLYREFKGKGFEIVAVNVKDKRDDAMKFVSNMKLTYPIMLDPQGEVGLLYGAWGMPATYLIDRNGVVLARLWGPAEWHSPAARNLIKALVEQKR
jgi:DsbE subfamily thiol:disulfide oxidoreductase